MGKKIKNRSILRNKMKNSNDNPTLSDDVISGKSIQEEGEKLKKYSCHACDMKYTKASKLRLHIKSVHEGLKKHQCLSCDKSYTQSHNLKSHIKIVHEGQKPVRKYRCLTCSIHDFDKRFYKKTTQ